MPKIQLDQQSLIDNIYHIISLVDISEEENLKVRDALIELVTLVKFAPTSELKSQFPRMGIHRG